MHLRTLNNVHPYQPLYATSILEHRFELDIFRINRTLEEYESGLLNGTQYDAQTLTHTHFIFM